MTGSSEFISLLPALLLGAASFYFLHDKDIIKRFDMHGGRWFLQHSFGVPTFCDIWGARG